MNSDELNLSNHKIVGVCCPLPLNFKFMTPTQVI
jgi:hypothetical protein